jgi:hypothetical protein
MEEPAFKLNKKPVNYLIHGQPLNYGFYFPYALFVIVYYKQLNQWYYFFKNFRILSNRGEYNGFTNAYNKNMYFICIGLHLGIVKKKFEINHVDIIPPAIHVNKPVFVLKNKASKLNFTMPKIKTLPKEEPKLNVAINIGRPALDINKETIFDDYETYKTENNETIKNKIYGRK